MRLREEKHEWVEGPENHLKIYKEEKRKRGEEIESKA